MSIGIEDISNEADKAAFAREKFKMLEKIARFSFLSF